MDERGAPTSRYGDPMAGYRTLGRLLWAGLLAGAVIGATVGSLVVGAAAYLPLGLMAGALAGMVAGVLTQGLALAVLLLARRAAPALSPPATYVVLGALPAASAGGLAWWVASTSDTGVARRLAVTGVALALAVAAVKLAAPWCLAPLVGRRDSADTTQR